jgi:GNAT superfamily N-acetyltransferase
MLKNFALLLVLSGSLLASDYTIIEESSNPEVCKKILDGLEDFNMHFFRQKDASLEVNSFVIYARDENSKILGGLCGYTFESQCGSWAHVDYAWVDESRRLQGLGTELFKRAEIFARTKNCQTMQLFTWAYQAVGFYEKLGFECVGVVPKWIENYDAVFFRKELK